MKATTERNQRQLHRLTRRAQESLSQPAAAVLATASKAMGFADLPAASDDASTLGGSGSMPGGPGGKPVGTRLETLGSGGTPLGRDKGRAGRSGKAKATSEATQPTAEQVLYTIPVS